MATKMRDKDVHLDSPNTKDIHELNNKGGYGLLGHLQANKHCVCHVFATFKTLEGKQRRPQFSICLFLSNHLWLGFIGVTRYIDYYNPIFVCFLTIWPCQIWTSHGVYVSIRRMFSSVSGCGILFFHDPQRCRHGAN